MILEIHGSDIRGSDFVLIEMTLVPDSTFYISFISVCHLTIPKSRQHFLTFTIPFQLVASFHPSAMHPRQNASSLNMFQLKHSKYI